MDKKVWEQDGFTLEVIPMWSCPFCDNAVLEIQKDQHGKPLFYYDETTASKRVHDQFYLDDEYRFIGMLQCSRCKEIISFSGDGGIERIPILDEFGYEMAVNPVRNFHPKSFTPPIHIFSIPVKCPKDVREIIIDSFSLFWVDYASCANKIRAAVESLLTHLDIRIISKSHKYKTLRARIEEYTKTDPEIGEMLGAIKWIGNAGSHDRRTKMNKSAILTAYEMLESVLIKLYDDKAENLKQAAEEINKNKGLL